MNVYVEHWSIVLNVLIYEAGRYYCIFLGLCSNFFNDLRLLPVTKNIGRRFGHWYILGHAKC